MRRLHPFLILILTLAFFQCKTTKYTPETFPVKQLIFGDGGGFSGIITEYLLLENGQFFKKTSLKEGYEELEPIKKAEAQTFYEQLEALRLHKSDIHHPGNLSYFIRMMNEEIDHTITWGAGDYNLRTDIMNFYKSLKRMTKNRKVIKSPEAKDK